MFAGDIHEIESIVQQTREKLLGSLLKALLNVRESSDLGEELSFKVVLLNIDGSLYFNDIVASDRVLKHLEGVSFTSYLRRWTRIASTFNFLDEEDTIGIQKGEINLFLRYMNIE